MEFGDCFKEIAPSKVIDKSSQSRIGAAPTYFKGSATYGTNANKSMADNSHPLKFSIL